MGIEIDKEGLRFTIRVALIIIVVAVSWSLRDYWSASPVPPAAATPPAPTAALTDAPRYRELSDGAVVYSHDEDVLARQNEFIHAHADFMFVDLAAMELTVYRGGEAALAVPIKAKGRPGSFFETPNGSYAVLAKESNHFSTIGKVWMPWSIHFFGNYFIHGWPYYPNGTPVADSYSGGCIRLGTADAKRVYELTRNGMPVLVSAGTAAPVPYDVAYFKKVSGFDRPQEISAEAALAADFETRHILFERDRTVVHSIASITKLMTGLVALESINRFKPLTVTRSALEAYGSAAGLAENEVYQAEEYLYPLLMASSNDAAAVYEAAAGNFVGLMNQKARAISLSSTRFADASGMSPENVSSPEDLFRLLRFIRLYKEPLFRITGTPKYTITARNTGRTHTLENKNWPAGDDRFVGGKSGFNYAAEETMAGVFRVQLSEGGGRNIAIIVLGSRDRVGDISRIIEYIEDRFVYGATVTRPEERPFIETGANFYEAVGGLQQIRE